MKNKLKIFIFRLKQTIVNRHDSVMMWCTWYAIQNKNIQFGFREII